MPLNLLLFIILLAAFNLSVSLQIKLAKNSIKRSINYYLTVIIPQSAFLIAILVLFIIYGNDSITCLVSGILICAIGFLARLKAFNDLKKSYNVSKEKMSNRVITNGIYSHVRHPLYLGTMLVYLGFCLIIFSKAGMALYFIFLIPLFLARIIEEEKEFAENMEYQEYKKKTSRLIPFVY